MIMLVLMLVVCGVAGRNAQSSRVTLEVGNILVLRLQVVSGRMWVRVRLPLQVSVHVRVDVHHMLLHLRIDVHGLHLR
jgi:hypothetical protein